MTSLFLRNLLFTILQPGIVAGLIPFLILQRGESTISSAVFTLRHIAGLSLFVTGFIIMVICIASFAVHGRGTLSPADPTKKLVVQGLYRYYRNPMYVGVMLMLIAESIFFKSVTLSIYSIGIFVMFNVFIRYREEPRLLRDFGGEYADYKNRVRKWI